jgi:hypothetical protein
LMQKVKPKNQGKSKCSTGFSRPTHNNHSALFVSGICLQPYCRCSYESQLFQKPIVVNSSATNGRHCIPLCCS